MKRALIALALLAVLAPSQGHAAVINLSDGNDLAAAVASANPNDQIVLGNGTYTLSSQLNVNQALTITGASEAGVIIDASAVGGYGMRVDASDVTLEYFTLLPPTPNYPIHASGTANPPNGLDNLTIQHVTIEGVHQRTGFDIHGYNNVLLSHLTSKDATGGNGVQITGCVNVDIDNITTANNAWGSLAVYVSGASYLSRGSDDVVIDGSTLSLGEGVLFQQDEGGFFSTNVSVPGYDYKVFNDTFRPDAAGYTFFHETQSDATTFALAFVDGTLTPVPEASSVQRISDGHWVVEAGMTIQTAIDDATAGGTVEVLAGLFVEQLDIGKDLSLVGAGAGVTTVQAFASMPLFFTTSANNVPVIYAHDADAVSIQDLTVDGAGLGNTNVRFYGVAYRNAGGGVYSCEIKDTRNTPLDGSQHGNAFYLYNNDTVARSMDVQDCDVYGFQKNGITLNSLDSTPLAVDVSGNTVTGAGVLTADNGDPAQNGIQLYGDLITGFVDNNDVDGIAYDNTNAATKWVATSILDFYSAADITNNGVTNAHVGIYKIDGPGTLSGNVIDIQKIGVYAWGIIATDPPRAIPQPLEEVSGSMRADLGRRALLNVLVDNNTVTFTGPDNTATYGLEADAGYGPDDLAVTFTNNTVTGFEAGVDIFQCQTSCDTGVFVSVNVNNNNFTGNTYGVRSNVDYLTVDATCNWYGDISGPAAVSPLNAGTGDAVEGDLVYWPWLDGPGGTCDQYGSDTVTANPVGEISPCNPCLSVPIVLNRADTSTLRGVSVTFQLSSELELCGPQITTAIGPGSLFDGFTNTQLFVVDNGGGSYTADVSLLGTPCGSIVAGDVIDVHVTNAPGIVTDATGTITVTDVTVRDCVNAPLPGIPGPPASVTINNGAPGAVADLDANQLKTGNDFDGTTKVNLSWTDPADPDLATIEIYRKGYGFYPEYDDGGGSVPAAPADISTALGAGWTFVASVPAGTGAYPDEPATRDFWYYVVFANDGCNDGGVSNRTGGTLNYHLGDVMPPGGNNNVGTGDVSALGIAYGTSDGDVNYDNVLDVGPTTDFFVDARPTTDDQIQFEDLMMFAINHGQVSKLPARPASAGHNALELAIPSLPAVGETFEVSLRLAADGSMHGLSAQVGYDRDQVEYLGFAPGDLASRQGAYTPVLSAEPARLDAAIFGTERGLLGEGTLATLRFRVKQSGDAAFDLVDIDARDSRNEETSLSSSVVSGTPGAGAIAKVTRLLPNVPNPFNPATEIRFVVGREGPVTVQIFSIQGRLIRTLVREAMDEGPQSVTWRGRDDDGRLVASGTYVVRIQAVDRTESRNIVLLK